MDELFPTPLPDETVYSLICRYSLIAAHADFKDVTLHKLGVSDSRPSNEYPPFLSQLAELAGIDVSNLLIRYTNIHYFQPFVDGEFYNRILNSLVNGQTGSIQSRLGSVAGRITPGKALKYCPICATEDTQLYGTAYWHRSHQLIGVTACCKHSVSLMTVRRPSKSILMPPLNIEYVSCSESESRLSFLISSELADMGAIWSKEDTYAAYLRRIGDIGGLTSTGRLRQKALKRHLKKNVSLLTSFPPPYPAIADWLLNSRYPENLFYQKQCNHQPLKHFLLIFSLFESWDDFKREVQSTKQVVQEKSLKGNKKKSSGIDWESALNLLSSGESLRQVAGKFCTTVSTLKIKALQKGICIDRRPSIVTPDIEKKIKERLAQGMKTKDIALQFGVSVGAVEKVLTQYPELPSLRKSIWYKQKFQLHRGLLLRYLSNNQNATRNDFREKHGSSYIWLYKHEKEWLYETLPARVKAIYWPRKTRKPR